MTTPRSNTKSSEISFGREQDTTDAFKIASLAEDAALGTEDRGTVNHQLNIYELMALGIQVGSCLMRHSIERWYHNTVHDRIMKVACGLCDKRCRKRKSSLSTASATALYAKWLKDGHPGLIAKPTLRWHIGPSRKQHDKIDHRTAQ